MILNAFYDGLWHHLDSSNEVESVVSYLSGDGALEADAEMVGDADLVAWLGFSHHRLGDSEVPDPFLRVGMNKETGFGGLVWGVTDAFPESLGVWVSSNPSPPSFDPRVVSDPGTPTFYEPKSTISLQLMRSVLEEFCYLGTGARPLSIAWVPGHTNGRRLDNRQPVEMLEQVDPWS